MAIEVYTRYSGGARDKLIPYAAKVRSTYEKAGAESYRMNQITTGPHTGHWLIVIRYKDWETYGRVQQSIAGNAEFRAMMAEVATMSQVVDRTNVVSVDF